MKKIRAISFIFISFCTVYPVHAQKIIHGFVSDAETGNVLPVAHIRVIGTRNGTISNEKGEYILELKTVPASVLVSYIGYKSETLLITVDSPEKQNIVLTPSPVILETIVVSGEDQAVRIMKEVIRRKQEWRASLETYIADAYTRVNMENDTRIVSISESISEIFWDIEQGTREVIKSERQTKNTKTNQNFASARMTPNLYDDDIYLFGFDVIGPTHPEALKYYDFSIIERRLRDDNTVYVLSVIPKSKLQPSLIGTISVLDEEYAMIDVDLKPNEAIMFPPPLSNFSFAVKQQFSNFDQEYWLPVDVRVRGEIKIKLPGLEFPAIKYNQLTRLSDYEVNVTLPDSLFQKKKRYIRITVSAESVSIDSYYITDEATTADTTAEETEAEDIVTDCTFADNETIPEGETIAEDTFAKEAVTSEPDSLFAQNSNVIPFTEEEKEAYSTIDSTMTMAKGFKPKGFLARLIKEDKDKKQKDKSGFTKAISRAFSGFSPQVWHNRVDAYHLGVKCKRTIKKRFTFELSGAYKTGQERWSCSGGIEYRWGEKRGGFIALNSATGTEPRYYSDNYPVWLNSVQTLSGKGDYFDYFRNDKTRAAVGYRFNKLNTKISAGINLEHHVSLSKSTDYTLLGSVKNQRENPSIQKGQLRSMELSISCGDSYSSFGVTGRKGAEIRIENSSMDLLTSDFSFTRYLFSLDWRFETFLKRRLFPNTLDVRFTGGTSTGELPIQRFGLLDGSFMVVTPFGAFRSLRNHPLEGEHYCALFVEHNFRTVPFELIGLRGVARKGIGIILHGASGRTWISEKRLKHLHYNPYYCDGFVNEIGFSVNNLFGIFRLDVTKRLDKGDVTLGFYIARIM